MSHLHVESKNYNKLVNMEKKKQAHRNRKNKSRGGGGQGGAIYGWGRETDTNYWI